MSTPHPPEDAAAGRRGPVVSAAGKRDLRRGAALARSGLGAQARSAASDALAALAPALLAVTGAAGPGRPAVVAAHVGVGAEPATLPLLDRLAERGTRVLLPLLLPDADLDWAPYEGRDQLVAARHGLLQPGGGALGPGAVTTAALVLVPALLVDAGGTRLGRGGGSYDRALARLAAAGSTAPAVAVLHDGELLGAGALPREPHDQPVAAVVTPGLGLVDLRPALPGGAVATHRT